MENLKQYAFQYVSSLVLVPLALMGARTTVSEISTTSMPELPALNVQGRLAQALELAVAGETSEGADRNAHDILVAVKNSIPKQFKSRAYEIARSVIVESNHHQMDPFLLLAMIKTESHFNIKARGRHGEVGLMQLMPETANWLAAQAGLSPGQFNLEDPRTNIRLGATYLSMLRREFKGYGARYIGAYNMGSANVKKLMAMDMDPLVYPGKVLKNYRHFYKTTGEVALRSIASTAKSKKPSAPKKLQTRAVIDKCGTAKCDYQPLMPGWTTS